MNKKTSKQLNQMSRSEHITYIRDLELEIEAREFATELDNHFKTINNETE